MNWQGLESHPIDVQSIFNSARDRTLSVLKRESEKMNLYPYGVPDSNKIHSPSTSLPGTGWFSFTDTKLDTDGRNPLSVKFPSGVEVSINSKYWADFIAEIANWLIQEGKLSLEDGPIKVGRSRRYFINTVPYQLDNNNSKFRTKRDLLNGMYVNTSFSGKQAIANINNLLSKYGENPSQFYIKLQQNNSA